MVMKRSAAAAGLALTRRGAVKRKRRSYMPPSRYLKPRSERKVRHYGILPFTINENDIWAHNPFSFIPVGSLYDQRNGNVIQNVCLHYKIAVDALAEEALGGQSSQSSHFRVLIFKHPKEWRTVAQSDFDRIFAGVGNSILETEILYDTGNDRAALSFTNNKEITVLHDRTVTVDRVGNPRGRGRLITGKITLPRLTYSNRTEYLKHEQIYFAVMASQAADATNAVVQARCRVNMLVSWNDY